MPGGLIIQLPGGSLLIDNALRGLRILQLTHKESSLVSSNPWLNAVPPVRWARSMLNDISAFVFFPSSLLFSPFYSDLIHG